MRTLLSLTLCGGLLTCSALAAPPLSSLVRTLQQEGYGSEEYDAALRQIAEHHAKDPGVSSIERAVREAQPTLLLEGLFRKIAAENPSASERLAAKTQLARILKEQGELGHEMKNVRDPVERETIAIIKGQDLLAKVTSGEPEKLIDQAEALLNEVIAEAAKGGGRAPGAAQSLLYEIQNLMVGKMAPETIGEDVNGNKIKLSSFRGQVVGMVFWGDW